MEQSNHPVVKTTEANLAEANEAIKAIEAQLLEVKACIHKPLFILYYTAVMNNQKWTPSTN